MPPGFYSFYYVDDLLIVGSDERRLVEVPKTVVEALTRAGFVVSGKSTLQPMQRIFFWGNWVDLVDRSIQSKPRADLQIFSIWFRLATTGKPSSRMPAQALGSINRHFRPLLQ